MLLNFERPKLVVLKPADMPQSWFDKMFNEAYRRFCHTFGAPGGRYYIQCDGVEDGKFFNEAIGFLPKNPGGKVFALGDTFAIGEAITGISSLWLQGAGPSTILQPTVALASHAFQALGKSNVKISDLTIDGNKAVATSSLSGVYLEGCADCELENMKIFDTKRHGIYTLQTTENPISSGHKFQHIYITTPGGKGMLATETGGGARAVDYLLYDVHVTGAMGETEGGQLVVDNSVVLLCEFDVTSSIGLTLTAGANLIIGGRFISTFDESSAGSIGLEMGSESANSRVIGAYMEAGNTPDHVNGAPYPTSYACALQSAVDASGISFADCTFVAPVIALKHDQAHIGPVTGCRFFRPATGATQTRGFFGAYAGDRGKFTQNIFDMSESTVALNIVDLAGANDVLFRDNEIRGGSGADFGVYVSGGLRNIIGPNKFYGVNTPYNVPTPANIVIKEVSSDGGVALEIDELAGAGAQEDWIDVTGFLNSWVNCSEAVKAQYYKDSWGRVYLQGCIKNGELGNYAFYLPVGYRPTMGKNFLVYAADVMGICHVEAVGGVVPQSGSNASFYLDQVFFRVT